jgi:uncharacterized iron-regulated membrane protein
MTRARSCRCRTGLPGPATDHRKPAAIHDPAHRHMTREPPATVTRLRSARGLLVGCLVLLLAATPVIAKPFHHPLMMMAQRGHSENGGISLDEAVRRARQQHRGKVLSAEAVRIDGRKVYRIKILTKDGRVKRIHIDARTGQTVSRGR